MKLRAPFPWFGGKSRVAPMVWPRFGDVSNYVEPFAGSLAVLLGRPSPPRVETVNDKESYLANFWRALRADPEHVAWWADWPVNEADLHARHRWLVYEGRERVARTVEDPDFYDCQIAGWWVWGQCLWIGSGWCAEPGWRGHRGGPNATRNARGIFADRAVGLQQPWKKKPHSNARGGSNGVHRSGLAKKRPISTGNGQGAGVHRSWHRRWQGGGLAGGSGVHAPTLWRQIPDLSGDSGAVGRGIHRASLHVSTDGLYDYLTALSERLRRVRVCAGDWSRVVTPSITTYVGLTAVFLDPPYQQDLRAICYNEDHDISAEVRAWCLEHGDNPKLRIALCGYADEHKLPSSWECVPWKAAGGYSRTERGVSNRTRERIWFSPHCLRPSDKLQFDEPVEVSA